MEDGILDFYCIRLGRHMGALQSGVLQVYLY
jgi:hypothetical protein